MKNMVIAFLICCIFSCDDNRASNLSYDQMDTLFDARLWKSGTRHLRGRMVKNLMERKILKGIHQDSVVKILGVPDAEVGDLYSYTLGTPDTTLLINWAILYIRIDSVSKKVEVAWLSD